MKHQIDPKIDCVFKALLGAEDNSNLLVHFLNAIIGSDLAAPLAGVDILNPYNDKEYLEDKLSIVDVKARDVNGNIYQIEIQLVNFANLPERILYNWADIYSQQLQQGEGYYQLRPTYSIWLLAENLIKDDTDYIHTYKIRDNKGRTLNNHCGIWLLELQKFTAQHVENEQQRWVRFFKEGEQLNDETDLPDWMTTTEMRQAMSTLKQFSDKDQDYHAYQARQNYLREQLTIQHELDEERKAKNEAVLREQAALKIIQEKDMELEQLKALLAKNNLH
jgi:predicted transposase/invertase (TIGR01784 family)